MKIRTRSRNNSFKSTVACVGKLDKKTNGFVFRNQGKIFTDVDWTKFIIINLKLDIDRDWQ